MKNFNSKEDLHEIKAFFKVNIICIVVIRQRDDKVTSKVDKTRTYLIKTFVP